MDRVAADGMDAIAVAAGAGIAVFERTDPWHEAVVEDLIMKAPAFQRVPAHYIRGGGLGRSGRGFADVYDVVTREIWEVKPFTKYGIGSGRPQLAQYISASGGRAGRRYAPSVIPSHDGHTNLITFSGSGPIEQGLRYYLPTESLRNAHILQSILAAVPAPERSLITSASAKVRYDPSPTFQLEFGPPVVWAAIGAGAAATACLAACPVLLAGAATAATGYAVVNAVG